MMVECRYKNCSRKADPVTGYCDDRCAAYDAGANQRSARTMLIRRTILSVVDEYYRNTVEIEETLREGPGLFVSRHAILVHLRSAEEEGIVECKRYDGTRKLHSHLWRKVED